MQQALHFSMEHAINIIEVAQEMGLVGQQYAWVLTASTVGDLSVSTVAASLPPGILGTKMYILKILYI